MTYAASGHLGRAISLCIQRCRNSSEPYFELSEFVGALRAGGVGETYIQSVNHAVLRDIANVKIGRAAKRYCYVVR